MYLIFNKEEYILQVVILAGLLDIALLFMDHFYDALKQFSLKVSQLFLMQGLCGEYANNIRLQVCIWHQLV